MKGVCVCTLCSLECLRGRPSRWPRQFYKPSFLRRAFIFHLVPMEEEASARDRFDAALLKAFQDTGLHTCGDYDREKGAKWEQIVNTMRTW